MEHRTFGLLLFLVEVPTPASIKHPHRILAVDGYRGIAVLLVILHHLGAFGIIPAERPTWFQMLRHAFAIGWAGVDVFFVISGFLITGILLDSKRHDNYFGSFYGRRLLRIFPLYYFALIVLAVASPHLAHPSVWSAGVWPWLYGENWLIAGVGFSAIAITIDPFWSLSIEEQFYCIWPLAVRLLTRRRLVALCGACVLISPALRAVVFTTYRAHPDQAAYTATFCRMEGLCLGALIACAVRDRFWKRWLNQHWAKFAIGSALTLGTIVAYDHSSSYQFFPMNVFGIAATTVLAGALLVPLTSGEQSGWRKLAETPALRFFGKYSYSLYCFHMAVIVFVAARVEHFMGATVVSSLLASALIFVLSILVALATWNVFEKRLLGFKDLPRFQTRPAEPAASQLPLVLENAYEPVSGV